MTGEEEEVLHEEICHFYFNILERHSLYLKPAKCEFNWTEINYLGIKVKDGELMINLAKIAGITEWLTTLWNIKEVPLYTGTSGLPSPLDPKLCQHCQTIDGPTTERKRIRMEYSLYKGSNMSYRPGNI
jgi:hypothetical protein